MTAKTLLEKIYAVVKGKRKILIVTHNNPDPDSLASALALRYLLHTKWKVGSVISYGGVIGRAENRAMVRYLNLDLKPFSEINVKNFSVVAVVDTQPGAGNNPLPKSIQPDIVIDHHSPFRARTGKAKVFDIRTDYGSTSTILAEYLLESDIADIDRKVATALIYGIKSDTRDLGWGSGPKDVAVSLYLYPRISFKLLSKIEHPEVPREYFKTLGKAISRARLYKDVVVLDLGHTDDVDVIAEMADHLLRIEGVKWSLCVGESGGTVFFSIRTKKKQGSADRIAQKMVKEIGSGGGHSMMAGGKAGGGGGPSRDYRELADVLVERFLKSLKRENITGQNL